MNEYQAPALEDCVVRIEKVGDYTNQLFSEERSIVKGAVRSRLFEFATGRHIARMLLSEMGYDFGPILRAESGRPLWPSAVRGSISHKNELCLVVLSNTGRYLSLGIDIEEVEPLEEGVWKVFTTGEELAELTAQGVGEAEAINVVFSVKEALYKCAYPLLEEATPPFAEQKISYKSLSPGRLEAECLHNSLYFKVIVSFDSKYIFSIAYV